MQPPELTLIELRARYWIQEAAFMGALGDRERHRIAADEAHHCIDRFEQVLAETRAHETGGG